MSSSPSSLPPPLAALAPGVPTVLPHKPPRRFALRRGLLAFAVAVMGLIDLASALLSHPPERLRALLHIVPSEVLETSRTYTLLAGSLLLVTAWGLRSGKRRAYVLALLLCAVSVPVNLLKALDLEEATVASTLMFALAMNAEAFRVRSRQFSASVWRSGAIWGLAGLLAYALAGDLVLRSAFAVEPSWSRVLADAAYHLFGLGRPVTLVTERLPARHLPMILWYLRSLPILGLTYVLLLAVAWLRPATHRRRHEAEVARARDLVLRYGESSVTWFALDAETDFFFSRNGRAVIPYRFESDVLLAIGDPVGPDEELPSLLQDFAAHCAERDWIPAIFQARPERLPLYRALGWHALHVGEEAVIDLTQFTLEGHAIGSVRRSAKKCEESGVTVRHFVPGVTPLAGPEATEWIEHMRVVSNQWLEGRPGGEKGFCMGRFHPEDLANVWVAAAWNATAARVEAFVTWVPIPARRGWALDLMRRGRDATPGVMELLVTSTAEAARERGDAMLSLALSALASVDDPLVLGAEPEISAAEGRARERLIKHLTRFYDFEGLFRWKKKFDPAFEDRYLVVPSRLFVPAVALALVRAQSSGGLRSYLRALTSRRSGPSTEPTRDR